MKPPQHTDPVRMSVNMTPMIDVVFQLIVFFTATSTMVQREYSAEVELPEAREGVARREVERKRVTANVLDDGTMIVAGESVSVSEFQRMLEADVNQFGPDRVEVLIRADRAARYAYIEPLLVLCARAGIWQVGLAVRRAELRR